MNMEGKYAELFAADPSPRGRFQERHELATLCFEAGRERMAHALQASLLLRYAPADVSEAFCATRLSGRWSGHYGAGPATSDARAIVERARIH